MCLRLQHFQVCEALSTQQPTVATHKFSLWLLHCSPGCRGNFAPPVFTWLLCKILGAYIRINHQQIIDWLLGKLLMQIVKYAQDYFNVPKGLLPFTKNNNKCIFIYFFCIGASKTFAPVISGFRVQCLTSADYSSSSLSIPKFRTFRWVSQRNCQWTMSVVITALVFHWEPVPHTVRDGGPICTLNMDVTVQKVELASNAIRHFLRTVTCQRRKQVFCLVTLFPYLIKNITCLQKIERNSSSEMFFVISSD